MKKIKKIALIALVLLVVCSSVFAKGKKDKNVKPETTTEQTEKPVYDINDPGFTK